MCFHKMCSHNVKPKSGQTEAGSRVSFNHKRRLSAGFTPSVQNNSIAGHNSSCRAEPLSLRREPQARIQRSLSTYNLVRDTKQQRGRSIINVESYPEPIRNLIPLSNYHSVPRWLTPSRRVSTHCSISSSNISDSELYDEQRTPEMIEDVSQDENGHTRDSLISSVDHQTEEQFDDLEYIASVPEELSDSMLDSRFDYHRSFFATRNSTPVQPPISSSGGFSETSDIEYREGPVTLFEFQDRLRSLYALPPVHKSGVKGAKWHNIHQLPTRTFKIRKSVEQSKSQNSCCVCMEDFDDDELLRTLPCLHFFHKKCIDKWLLQNSSCPICKFDILKITSPILEETHNFSFL